MDLRIGYENENYDLSSEDSSLVNSVLISIYSDARSSKEELPEGEPSQRGWFGDLFNDYKIGSLLWTLKRRKINSELLEEVEEVILSCLAWLETEEIVSSIQVKVESSNDQIRYQVSLTKPNGEKLRILVNKLWDATKVEILNNASI